MLIQRLLLLPAILFSAVVGSACLIMIRQPVTVDFLSFWAAGRLALQGAPALAYDLSAHRAVEYSVVTLHGLLPFFYPPPMLFLLAPFGALPLGPAFVAWIILTGGFYVRASGLPIRVALAHPAVVANGLIGQVAFLTTGIFALGCNLLRDRPFLAGIVLGLLTLKPQIAALFPLALIAGRHWHALAGAACSAIAVLALSVLVFGIASLTGFIDMLPRFAEYMALAKWDWNELASLYAAARHAGATPAIAGIIHLLGLAFGLWCTLLAWSKDHEAKVPIIAAASLLVPPYLLNYDALLLVIPFAWLLLRNRVAAAVVIWLLALIPIVLDGFNPMSLAAVLSLVAMLADRRPTRLSTADQDSNATPTIA